MKSIKRQKKKFKEKLKLYKNCKNNKMKLNSKFKSLKLKQKS